MARKSNGWGSANSFKQPTFKGLGKVTQAPAFTGAGKFPSFRDFGTIVQQTIIQRTNMLSMWKKWRHGYELFCKGKIFSGFFDNLFAEIFPVFDEYISIRFGVQLIPSNESDTGTRYVIQRLFDKSTPAIAKVPPLRVGGATPVGGSSINTWKRWTPEEQAEYNETWFFCEARQGTEILPKLIGDRVTSKYTIDNANVPWYVEGNHGSGIIKDFINFFTGKPLFYNGTTDGSSAQIKVRLGSGFSNIPPEFFFSLEGNVSSFVNLPTQWPAGGTRLVLVDYDSEYYLARYGTTLSSGPGVPAADYQFWVWDGNSSLSQGELLSYADARFRFKNTDIQLICFIKFKKSDIERYWEDNAIDLQYIKEKTVFVCPMIPAGINIKTVTAKGQIDAATGKPIINDWEIELEQFNMEFKLVHPYMNQLSGPYDDRVGGVLVVPNDSMAKEYWDRDVDHTITIDPDPRKLWGLDAQGNAIGQWLYMDSYWTCDCPSYSLASVKSPEEIDESGGERNRQPKYPMPSAGQSQTDIRKLMADYEAYSGTINSWESPEDRKRFRVCKHTVAAYFNQGIRFIEPKDMPLMEDLQTEEEKITGQYDDLEINTYALKRNDISPTQILWSMVQALIQDSAKVFALKSAAATGAGALTYFGNHPYRNEVAQTAVATGTPEYGPHLPRSKSWDPEHMGAPDLDKPWNYVDETDIAMGDMTVTPNISFKKSNDILSR